MMTHAYNKSYLSHAKNRLSQFFDYAINDCNFESDWIAMMFVQSGYAEQFERGNPAILAGMSGVELAQLVINKIYKEKELPSPSFGSDKSPEYWAGWALAEYQWYTGRRFKDIFEYAPLSKSTQLFANTVISVSIGSTKPSTFLILDIATLTSFPSESST